ncbi:MAG: pyridoxal-phosphate dependent enzyme, partial [Hadesarchaea archaeon]|nr:pyridoxal-phosphate dependent enzyme [Hadesarchaea archaeon]
AALSAYSAKGGIECYAFVPDDAPEGKLAQLSIYGANVIKGKPKGTGDPTYKLMRMGFENFGWHPVPSGGAFNPYQPEGSKTISYEICEQLDWNSPDWVLTPVGAGTLLSGNAKGYFEFEDLGFIDEVPKLGGIQASGCAPLVRGFKEDIEPSEIPCWENPDTVAGGLIDPYPWDADTAIPAIKRSGGVAEAVSCDDILSAEKLLAKTEGIFAEPSGAAGLAGLIKLVEEGSIDKSDQVVVQVTGGGLKDQEVAIEITERPPSIEPELNQLRELIKK